MIGWRRAVLLALVMSLAGCWGGDADPAPAPVLTVPTKAPTQSGGWSQSVKPERPKDFKSEQSLRAYIDYIVAVPPYAFASRDPSVLAGLGDAATCRLCAMARNLSEFHAQEVNLYEERPTVRIVTIDDPSADRFVVKGEIHFPPSQRLDPRSGAVRAEEPAQTFAVQFEVEWVDGRWELVNHGPSY